MKRPRGGWTNLRPELLTLAACLLLTGAHVGYRTVVARSEPAPIRVSDLAAGASVQAAYGFDAPANAACRLIITFSPDCPFCKRASDRERETARVGAYASTTWVTEDVRESLAAFVARLPTGATHLVDGTLYEALEVRAVPGIYLLDGQGRVRWVGPYRGDESSEVLQARCDGVQPFGEEETSE